MQANDIFNTYKFLTESHLHILVNKYQCKVILMTQRAFPGGIVGSLFKPGYNPSRLLPRNTIKQLKEREEQLVFMYVDFPPTHFEAYVPAIEVRSRPRQMVDLS